MIREPWHVGVLDEIGRMLVVACIAHVMTYVVQIGRRLGQFSEFRRELMQRLQSVEQLAR
jgi:hypothetical protein